jgi:sigma-B regulation protein RsbU (phosphoserine phosphatase)
MRRPNQVLATLNDAFPGERHGQRYFTAWYGVYERSKGSLTWSAGGHHPSILLAPGASQPILLPSSGTILGMISGLDYPAGSCQVATDARLLIFSDGVFEIIRDRRVVWDLDAYIQFLSTQNLRGGPLMDALLAHMRALRGSHKLADDFSILEACFGQSTQQGRR